MVGHKRTGIANLKSQIANAKVAPMPDWPLPEAMKDELLVVGGGLAILDSEGVQRPTGSSELEPVGLVGLASLPSAARGSVLTTASAASTATRRWPSDC